MAPVLSTQDNKTLEETIKSVYETLKRTENRTLDTKRRAQKTLEDSSQHLSKAQQIFTLNLNGDRLTESLNYCRDKQNNHSAFSPQYASLDKRGTPNRARLKQTCPIPSKNGAKKISTSASGGGGNTKLRTVIIKTLDKLFQMPNRSPSLAKPSRCSKLLKSSSKEHQPSPECVRSGHDNCLSLQELKELNQRTDDTLPRDSTFFKEHDRLLNENAAAEAVDCSYDESSSEDDSCWEFINAPLKVVDVALDDTLPQTNPNSNRKTENVENLMQEKNPPVRYRKKEKKPGENSRIEKRASERQAEKVKNEIFKVDDSKGIPEDPGKLDDSHIFRRPDSPVQKYNREKFTAYAVSLPNLVEACQELDSSSASTLSDCGSDTFKRNIYYCPSSTLSKSVPSFAENHENEDDACSSSSSFSSFQRGQVRSSTSKVTHKSTLPKPSALLNDVLVHPINVPIKRFGSQNRESTIIGVAPQTFQELSEVFISGGKAETVNRHTGLQKSSTERNSSADANRIGIERLSANFEECHIKEEQTDSDKSSSNSSLISNTSIPPPPPFPPPPPPAVTGAFPVTVFTRRQSGKCIFNEMPDIQIDETDAKMFKEKFPFKPARKGLKRRLGKDKTKEFSASEKKFLRNIELFLRTYRIDNYEHFLRCILTLNTKGPQVETEWFTTLTQFIPKIDEIEIMRHNSIQKFDNNSTAGKFIVELLKIKNLHGKLFAIQFALDFHDGCLKLSKWTDAFIAACDTIKMSDKFVSIINVIMGLLQSLPDEESEIYGFDIQELTRLATRTSEDGSSTFLQFVIEYMLDKPDLSASVDFYKAFTDLPDVTKTCVKDMRKQCQEWETDLNLYKAQIDSIMAEKQMSCSELKCASISHAECACTLKQLNSRLDHAQQSFDSCKERFGLLNSETTEVMFFESLSKFVMTYQKIYTDIVARRQRIKQNQNKRASMHGGLGGQEDSTAVPNSNVLRRKSLSGADIKNMCRSSGNGATVENGLNPVNLRRKSCTPREIKAMIDDPTTEDFDKCLLDFLTKDEKGENIGKDNRPRKRVSMYSKLPLDRN